MTDRDLVEKRLAFIERCVADLDAFAEPDRLASDPVQERFVEHTLQVAIQAAIDVASHIISDERLPEPSTYRELFRTLGARGYLPPDLSSRLESAAGFRNVVVHLYDDVDLGILRQVLEHGVGDLLAFVATVRTRFPLDERGEGPRAAPGGPRT